MAAAAEAAARPAPPGRPAPGPTEAASAGECNAPGINASGDDAVTLLAYLQVVAVRLEAPPGAAAGSAAGSVPAGHRAGLARFLRQPAALDFYLHLLRQLALALDGDPGPKEPVRLAPERVQPFLQAGPAERARRLAEAWRDSREWNDLLAVPGLVFEGQAWRNDPHAARQTILALLAQVPPGVWWSSDSFVAALKERQPDFQRPAGDYDSWYIRDSRSGAFLRGFENWDRVDGALVHWLIEQPLRWLGVVEIWPQEQSLADSASGPSARSRAPAFRLTPYGAALLGLAGWPEAPEPARLLVQPGGLVRAAAGESAAPASGYDRFQLARIGDWLPPETASAQAPANVFVYPYRLTPASLARAVRKGITIERIIAFLERAAAGQPRPAGAGRRPAPLGAARHRGRPERDGGAKTGRAGAAGHAAPDARPERAAGRGAGPGSGGSGPGRGGQAARGAERVEYSHRRVVGQRAAARMSFFYHDLHTGTMESKARRRRGQIRPGQRRQHRAAAGHYIKAGVGKDGAAAMLARVKTITPLSAALKKYKAGPQPLNKPALMAIVDEMITTLTMR